MSNKELLFTFEKRKKLESYIEKNLSKNMIAKIFGISRSTLYNELEIGLLIEGDYNSYSALKAQAYIKEKAWEEYQWKVR